VSCSCDRTNGTESPEYVLSSRHSRPATPECSRCPVRGRDAEAGVQGERDGAAQHSAWQRHRTRPKTRLFALKKGILLMTILQANPPLSKALYF